MSARNEDFLFAQEAQNLGYVTEAQVEEGFLLQKRMADDLQIDERLAVILVKRGWMAEEQARRVYGIIEPEGARSQIEGYRLVEKVGRGAMGTVYKAMHKGLNRVVAIKILRRDLAADKTQIERLKREAKLLAELEHPNVVRAFDAGESNGFPYLVMEYVEGETLRDKIAREGPLPEDVALRITRDIADALEKARRMGVVHRDVKPGNILVKKDGSPKLMDLGLAKGPIDADLTQHGATVGTPQFMSPEQAESPDKADTRSDIYSLGATLYAMVTGKPPFEGSTLAEIITKVMSQQPVPPGMINREVSAEVNHLIERMMLKDASLRYATPALLIDDIDRIRGGQSIVPRGFQGNWEAYLLRKRFLEWRKRIVLGVAGAAVLVVGLLLFLDHQRKQIAERDMEAKSAALLEIPGVQPGDDEDVLTQRLKQLRAGDGELSRLSDDANVPYLERGRIEGRMKQLEEALKLLATCAWLREKEVPRLRAQGHWREAMVALRDHKSELERQAPSGACWQQLVNELRKDAREALQHAEAEVAAMAVADVSDLVAKYRARELLYERPWIQESDFGRRKTAARTAHEKARTVGKRLATFQLRFAPATVQERVEAIQFYDLRREFTRESETLRTQVRAEIESWPESPRGERALVQSQLFGESGIVAASIHRADNDIDARVRAFWEDLKRRLATMPVEDALALLDRFENEAARGNHYGFLAQEARAEAERLRTEARARKEREQRAFEQLREQVLGGLERGSPRAIREAIDAAQAGTQLSPARAKDADALREAAAALERLQQGALAWLESQRAAGGTVNLDNVRYRSTDGTMLSAKRLVLRDLDTAKGLLFVRIPRGDRRGTAEIRIGDVEIPVLLRWYARTGRKLEPVHAAILTIAELPPPVDKPGVDLRPVLRAYRALQDRFGEQPPGPQWRRLVGELALRLEGWQGEREDEARRAIQFVKDLFYDDDWKGLIELVDKLLDPQGKLRWTQAVEDVIDDMIDKRRWAREALDKDELRRLFAGDVKPTELAPDPDGRRQTQVRFDFDDVKQLENFEHGFARWMRSGPPVTTGAHSDRLGGRLDLLPGVKGFLRDRPLVLRSMFDPARPISLEVKANLLRGSAMLAFDLDGVQVAICSFDPNFWKRRFLVDAPRLPDEEALPEFDFYGMGRGIAFHHGPHFGHSFPFGSWDWAVAGQGRNFVKLKERATIRKAGGRLFAFEPGSTTVTIRIERDRNFLRLIVGGTTVYEGENHHWSKVGATSEIDPGIRNGSGRIQILTWTPMQIDDLVLTGTLREGWKAARRKALAAAASKDAGPGSKEDGK